MTTPPLAAVDAVRSAIKASWDEACFLLWHMEVMEDPDLAGAPTGQAWLTHVFRSPAEPGSDLASWAVVVEHVRATPRQAPSSRLHAVGPASMEGVRTPLVRLDRERRSAWGRAFEGDQVSGGSGPLEVARGLVQLDGVRGLYCNDAVQRLVEESPADFSARTEDLLQVVRPGTPHLVTLQWLYKRFVSAGLMPEDPALAALAHGVLTADLPALQRALPDVTQRRSLD